MVKVAPKLKYVEPTQTKSVSVFGPRDVRGNLSKISDIAKYETIL